MKAIEREIFRQLYARANAHGFECVRFACSPATGLGEEHDAIQDPTLDDCLAHARAWDSDSVVEFSNGKHEFWTLLVWGNGEDLISDYRPSADAEAIIGEVYAWIES